MNKLKRKENINPTSVLSDATNVRKTRNNVKKAEVLVEKENLPKNTAISKGQKGRKVSKKAVKPETKKKKTETVEKEIAPKLPKSPYCFGFSDSDLENDISPYNGSLTEFDSSKPYRLALYVKPSKRIRFEPAIAQQLQNLNPTLNLTNINVTANMTMNSIIAPAKKRHAPDSVMSPDKTKWKVPFASTPIVKKPKGKMVQKKITDVLVPGPKRTRAANANHHFSSFFETSTSTDEETLLTSPILAKPSTKRKVKEPVVSSTDSSEDDPEQPTRFQKPSRRSYVKKPRPPREPEDETPSEEILKTMETTKKKGKGKRPEKDDEEFEKWSRSMNSIFSEVEQFDLSFD